MKLFKILNIIGIIVLIMACVKAYSKPEWYSIGLEEREVYCLLADDTTMILAGTNQGLYVLFDSEWYLVEGLATNLPINSMVRVSETKAAVSAGGGSNSDGLYIGEVAIYGPPFYVFSLIDYLMFPQALTASSEKGDTLFLGSNNGIYMSILGEDEEYGVLEPIKTPDYCFGVEEPLCATLLIFHVEGILYAGGYDLSPLPGPGHLLRQQKDSMVIAKDFNVSAMTQGTFSSDEPGIRELAVGTPDSGIIYYNPIISSTPWRKWESPENEAIRHIIALSGGENENDMLIAAVESGVYIDGNEDIITGSWTVIGDLPNKPNFIAGYLNGKNEFGGFAGTDKGVYRYGEKPTGIAEKYLPKYSKKSCLKLNVFNKSTKLQMVFHSDAVIENNLTVILYDISGKRVNKVYTRSGTADFGKLGSGIYLFSVFAGENNITGGKVVVP